MQVPWSGPAELSVNHPDAISAIHSSKSSCIKSPWYDILQPHRSVFGTRDRAEHQHRRRVWDHAFRPSGKWRDTNLGPLLPLYSLTLPCGSCLALKEYEPSLRACVNQLADKVSNRAASGTPVNMTLWFGCLMFDVRGSAWLERCC
jgi:cytochrome P450